MMGIAALVLLFAVAWFIPWRLRRMLGFKPALMWGLFALILLGVAGFGLVVGTGRSATGGAPWGWIYNALGLFFMFILYVGCALFVAWPAAHWLKSFSQRKIAAAAVLISLFFVGVGFFNAQRFTVTEQAVALPDLTCEVSVMHVSDLHLGTQRGERYLRNVVDAINERHPDLVLYNGDVADSNAAQRPELFALFRDVKSEQFFTMGNHEYYIDTPRVLGLLEANGVNILRNRMVETHGIQLIGLEYMNADRTTFDAHRVNDLTVEEELPKIARDRMRPVLLAHHTPKGFHYAAQGGVDLMLSGHTHNGQVFPGMLFTTLLFPQNCGRYAEGAATLLVSQGAGTFGPWMRLGSFNELQFIRLIPEK